MSETIGYSSSTKSLRTVSPERHFECLREIKPERSASSKSHYKTEDTLCFLIMKANLTDALAIGEIVSLLAESRDIGDAWLILPSVHINLVICLKRIHGSVSVDFTVGECDD